MELIANIKYGMSNSQEGDLYLPDNPYSPVITLFHGGFWKYPYGREQFNEVAVNLAEHGFAIWNLGYRRIGEQNCTWKEIIDDAKNGFEYLQSLVENGLKLDITRNTILGHSAGGHIAFMLAAQIVNEKKLNDKLGLKAIIGLAPILDLRDKYLYEKVKKVLVAMLGSELTDDDQKYREISPIDLLPFGIKQLILHGTNDEEVKVVGSRKYVEKALEYDEDIELIESGKFGHMDYLNPSTEASKSLINWLKVNAKDN